MIEGIVLSEFIDGAEEACWCGGAGVMGTSKRVDVRDSAD